MAVNRDAQSTSRSDQARMDRRGSEGDDASTLHLYWFDEAAFFEAKEDLIAAGINVVSSMLTPCQVMRASGNKVVYASPEVWSRICVRQGSWYRESKRFGQYMMMSERKLPSTYDRYLDAEITKTDFKPETLPSTDELRSLVESRAYQDNKPAAWEEKGVKDALMFKVLFSLTRFWGWGDNLAKHWLSHKAHHANFLAHHFTTEIDGESVPYSVAENSGICSSCVEYFNLIDDTRRKLVRSCPGAVTFGGTQRDVYVDVNPVQNAHGESQPQ